MVLIFLVYACHWIGCLWWTVGELEQDRLVLIDMNASSLRLDPSIDRPWGPSPWLRETQPLSNQYLHALFWGAGLMTGFVPFDVAPSTMLETLVTVLALFLGLVVNTIIISSSTTALQSISFKSSRVVHKMQNVHRHMRHKHVPTALSRKIIAFYEYQLSPHRSGEGQHELSELPPALAMELIMHTHQELFRECPIFRLVPPPTALSLVEHFEAMVMMPDEVVIHEGAPNASLFVINRGLVSVWRRDANAPGFKQKITTLTDNDFFGEQTLLRTINGQSQDEKLAESVQANATCQCASYCDLFRLTAEDFTAVLDQARSRRHSWAGKDVANILSRAAYERNSRAERLRKRSLMWAAASQEALRARGDQRPGLYRRLSGADLTKYTNSRRRRSTRSLSPPSGASLPSGSKSGSNRSSDEARAFGMVVNAAISAERGRGSCCAPSVLPPTGPLPVQVITGVCGSASAAPASAGSALTRSMPEAVELGDCARTLQCTPAQEHSSTAVAGAPAAPLQSGVQAHIGVRDRNGNSLQA